MKLILASNSPRRKELLSREKIKYEIATCEIDESWDISFSPLSTAMSLAYQKGIAVANKNPKDLILSADTIVVLGDDIIGKPVDKSDAKDIISSLNGKIHKVITAFSLISIKQSIKYMNFDVSSVKFKDITEDEIDEYINTDEPYDKAGAYAIQGKGEKFVQYYHGSLDNIIGLPTQKVVFALNKFLKE